MKIKFRAWDSQNNKMLFDYQWIDNERSLHMGGGCHRKFKAGKLSGNTASAYHHIMQYTGLNDKNGKEIYEGDIVNANMDFGPGGYQPVKVSISWVGPIEGFQLNYFEPESIEVIGNVYEAPND